MALAQASNMRFPDQALVNRPPLWFASLPLGKPYNNDNACRYHLPPSRTMPGWGLCLKRLLVFQYAVADVDQFAHGGDESHHFAFALL